MQFRPAHFLAKIYNHAVGEVLKVMVTFENFPLPSISMYLHNFEEQKDLRK